MIDTNVAIAPRRRHVVLRVAVALLTLLLALAPAALAQEPDPPVPGDPPPVVDPPPPPPEPDTTPPTVTLQGGPDEGSFSREREVSFSFTSEAGARFTCSLDRRTVADCVSGTPIPLEGDGRHLFAVRATDGAGNASEPQTRTWTTDTAPPALRLDAEALAGSGADPSFTFTVQDESEVSLTCAFVQRFTRLAAPAPLETCASGQQTFRDLGAGTWEFSVQAVDAAGNPAVRTRSWTCPTRRSRSRPPRRSWTSR